MFTSFKRIIGALGVFALVASSFAFGGTSASAQTRTGTNAPGRWASAILIQNTGTGNLAPGDYSITFYDTNGTQVGTPFTPSAAGDAIAVGASKEFYVPSRVSSLPAGQYSAVISSTQRVKAVVNSSTDSGTTGPWSAFSYEGIAADAAKDTLYFPAIYRNYFGFLSEMVIQNTGASPATVQATFYNGINGAASSAISLGSIPANASKTFSWNDAAFASLVSGNQGIYGVVVKSTNGQLLAGISNIWSSSSTNFGVGSYNAFTAGSDKIYAAALYNQYFGFVSSLTIQNIDPTNAAGVTITYSDGSTDSFSIPANQSRERFQPNKAGLASGNTNGLLSATIQRTTTTGSIVAIVNIQRKARGSLSIADPTNPAFGSYSATSASSVAATTATSVPAIFNNYFGYFTAVSVRNSGNTTTDITLTYPNGVKWTQTGVTAGKTVNFAHLGNTNGNPLTGNVQTAATVTSSNNQPLVVIVQHNTDSTLSTYRPAKAPNDFLFVLSGFPN